MKCLYTSVHFESLGVALPSRVVTSEALEKQLAPAYERLGLHVGRLELMTGIASRHWGEPGLKPSDLSTHAAEKALLQTSIAREKIGCLIHTSVCRDYLEPATATAVHRNLGLSPTCQVFDLSNACLGWMDGITTVANMIELGHIEAGLVVSGEDGRALVESTIKYLNEDLTLTRQSIKGRFASLTIGSGGVAVLLTSKNISKTNHTLIGASSMSATHHNELCQGGVSPNESTRTHVDMLTDSEAMLQAGVELAAKNWHLARAHLGWNSSSVNHFITHQVGSAHRKLLFEKLELDQNKDFSTFSHLGNMGSASIGATLAIAAEKNLFKPSDQLLMMGIGSGLVSLSLGVTW